MDHHSSLLDLTLPELTDAVRGLGAPEYRARQLWHGLYRRFATSYDELSDLPRDLREALAQRYRVAAAAEALRRTSADASTDKFLLRLDDGELIETVLMRYDPSEHGRGRTTVCLSTQAGCAMACSFCATGQQGFRRNLSAGEIVEQALVAARHLRADGEHLTNIVFMGMGEPLANYAATLRAVRTLNDAGGFNLGARHMTLSTVGLVSGIRKLAREGLQIGLAISLHAPDDRLRRRLIPTASQPIATILDACNEYTALTGRRYSVEYALMDGVNDSAAQARDLAALLVGLPCHVNLIPVNPTASIEARRPSRTRMLAFERTLLEAGIACTVRVEKGIDIMAGCGQLRGEHAAPLTLLT